MSGRKKTNFERRRLELVAEADWIERIHAQAERLGTNLSAYIRMAVTRQVERDEQDDPSLRPRIRKQSAE